MIDYDLYPLPNVAIAFFLGDPFSTTINDPTIFSITMQQMTKYQDVTKEDTHIDIPL